MDEQKISEFANACGIQIAFDLKSGQRVVMFEDGSISRFAHMVSDYQKKEDAKEMNTCGTCNNSESST